MAMLKKLDPPGYWLLLVDAKFWNLKSALNFGIKANYDSATF